MAEATITLDDVATAAGVHPSTVSRALSRPDLVRAATLARVTATAERLGYVPNRAARRLAGGRTATLAMLVPDITNPFFATIVRAAQHRADDTGRLIVLVDTGGEPDRELDAVASLAPDVDGIIAASPVAATSRLAAAAEGRPLVLANRRARGLASVAVDQDGIVTTAVDHLRDLGHHRIAVLRGPAGYWSSTRRDRCVARLGDGLGTLGPGEPTFAGGRAALAEVRDRDATAVIAFNDVMGLGLLAAAADAGLAVPDDLSVIGVDGLAVGAMTSPALSTVAAPLDQLGELAVGAVLDGLAGAEPGPGHRSLAPHLVTRGSTGPAKVAVAS